MKSLLRLCGLFLLMALPAAWGQPSSLQVSKIEIQHVGPADVSDALIRANIRVKPGDPYRTAAVDDDIRNLYATGLFYNIRTTEETSPSGVIVTYIVQTKPRITGEFKFQGNTKFSDAKLRKKLTSKVGDPLDDRKLFTDQQELEQLYQKKGYPGTTVKAVPNIFQETGRATVTFEIHESPKIRVTDVEFVGAHAFSQRKLRNVVKTRRHWFLSWITTGGVYKEDQLEDDRDRLTEFYRSKGYIDFEIKEVRLEKPTPRSMVIRFIVYEGRQYKVGSVTFTGNKVFSTAEIAKGLRDLQPKGVLAKKAKLGPNGLKMDVGDTFTPEGMDQVIQQVEDFYGSRGYIDVTAGRTLNVARIANTETGTMDLEFRIDEGQRSTIEKIEIRGNTITKDRVIRRELAVSPGEVFDMVRVRISKQRLEGMDYFEKVDARPEPTAIMPTAKNLVVGVDEKNTGKLTVGAGFSSVDALVGFAEVEQRNFDLFNPPKFRGGGQKLRLRAQIGTVHNNYEVEFVEPWFLERKLQLDVRIYYDDMNFLSPNNLYREVDAGGRVGLSRALGSDFLIGGVGYTIEEIGIFFNREFRAGPPNPGPLPPPPPLAVPVPTSIAQEQGYSLITKFDASIAYDTRNSAQLPDKGQRTQLTAEVAGPFGGSKDFYKLEAKTDWFFKGFLPAHVIELTGGTGIADAYGSSSTVPFYERYYLGGLNTLRGFRFRNVSPREIDATAPVQSNEPVGGDTYWFGSVEYSIPIIERVRFVAFYDIGNVMVDSYSYSFSNFSDNWGIGLRLNLPIGPMRLEYGIPIHHDKYNSGSGQFQFGVGYYRGF